MFRDSSVQFEAIDGGLQISAPAEKKCVTVLLATEHVLVSADSARCLLAWDQHGHGLGYEGLAKDFWTITQYAHSRGNDYGLAVRVAGACETDAAEVVQATQTLWRRINTAGRFDPQPSTPLPMISYHSVAFCTRSRATLHALTSVLADRPELRARLAEPARVAALAAEITGGLQAPAVDHSGWRGSTQQIGLALRRLGYQHHYGRPLSRADLPELSDVVERVAAELARSPWGKAPRSSRWELGLIVKRQYLGVQPWPFSALVGGHDVADSAPLADRSGQDQPCARCGRRLAGL